MIEVNKKLANHLRLIGQLTSLDGGNRFSIKAWDEAAATITNLPMEVTQENVMEIPGVGAKIGLTIKEFITAGCSSASQVLAERWPIDAMSMTIVDGIGPKRAYKLYEKGILNFEQLHVAALAGELDAKLTTNVVLASFKKSGRIPFHAANQIGNYFKENLAKVPGVSIVEVGGSIRRKTETSKDVDILACVETEKDRPTLMEAFKFFGSGSFQGQETKASIQYPISGSQVIQIDLWIADKSYWGTLLNHVTGSKDHNVAIRTLAKSQSLSISEYGIFDNEGLKLGGENEHDLYRILDIPWVEPENRTGILPEGKYHE